jgi:class 3 adenylate cyclase
MQSRLNANAAGFGITDIYIMIDSGEKKGFFKDHICFLMDSRPWSDDPWWDDPSFPGEPYEYEPSFTYWRQLSLEGKSGFDHNPIGRPEDWFLPRFSVDEWGTWFSVWLTIKTAGVFNIFTIDMEASGVKRLLLTIGGIVVGAGLVLVVMVTLLTRWLSNRVTRPITELTRGAREVAQGNYDYVVPVLQEDEFGELTHRFNEMTRGQAERVNLMETLKKILSEELALQAAKDGMVLGGVQKDCTVMFTDFAGFSTITQHMKAVEAVELINTYFEELVTIIKKYGGFPDKYIGDAIVAMFGAPVHFDDHAERAVACAVEMQWKLREINDRLRRQDKTCFEMRIGLNSGEVLAGAIGCDMKLEYTSIGETVNLANRMESIAEIGHIKIAEGTYKEIRTIFFKGVNISRTPEKLSVKGYPEPVDCYNIYIDNIRIQKNSKPTDPLIDYYIYENIDRDLKYEPWEEESVNFTKHSRFTKEWDALFQNT